jgi:hypothetical protein
MGDGKWDGKAKLIYGYCWTEFLIFVLHHVITKYASHTTLSCSIAFPIYRLAPTHWFRSPLTTYASKYLTILRLKPRPAPICR